MVVRLTAQVSELARALARRLSSLAARVEHVAARLDEGVGAPPATGTARPRDEAPPPSAEDAIAMALSCRGQVAWARGGRPATEPASGIAGRRGAVDVAA